MDDSITLSLLGDIFPADQTVMYGIGVRSKSKRLSYDSYLKPTAEILRRSDVIFGNLEVPLSDLGANEPADLFHLQIRGEERFAGVLAKVNKNWVVSLANNHTGDYGNKSFEDTVRVLNTVGVSWVGLPGQWLEKVVKSQKMAFYALSVIPSFRGTSIPYHFSKSVDEAIPLMKRDMPKDGVKIVSVHWGTEFMAYPSIEQITDALKIFDSGVDIIIGHHPHRLQGYEYVNGKAVFYSLGNFIYDGWRKAERLSAISQVEIKKDKIKSVVWVPIWHDKNGIPVLRCKFMNQLKKINEKVRYAEINRISMPQYYEKVQRYRHLYRMSVILQLFLTIWRRSPRQLWELFLWMMIRFRGLIELFIKRSVHPYAVYSLPMRPKEENQRNK